MPLETTSYIWEKHTKKKWKICFSPSEMCGTCYIIRATISITNCCCFFFFSIIIIIIIIIISQYLFLITDLDLTKQTPNTYVFTFIISNCKSALCTVYFYGVYVYIDVCMCGCVRMSMYLPNFSSPSRL